MVRRYARRADNSQTALVDALRSIPGVSVEPDHDDLLVGYAGHTYWFEIKTADNSVSKRTGTVLESRKQKNQKRLDQTWTGHRAYAWNIDQILDAIGVPSCQRPVKN